MLIDKGTAEKTSGSQPAKGGAQLAVQPVNDAELAKTSIGNDPKLAQDGQVCEILVSC